MAKNTGGTRSLVACDVTGAVFRHTLILSFFWTAIAPVQPAAPIVSNCRTISRDIGPEGRGADISIHQGQDLDPIALLDIGQL